MTESALTKYYNEILNEKNKLEIQQVITKDKSKSDQINQINNKIVNEKIDDQTSNYNILSYLDDFVSKLNNISNNNKINQSRISWNEYFMSIALLISCRSSSERLKVGSVIVKDFRIISTGYNGFIRGAPHISIVRDNHEQNTIHSEQNAIAFASRRGSSIEGSEIYITHFPCINCTKFIIASGIIKIYYLHDYKNDDLCLELLKLANICITKIDKDNI